MARFFICLLSRSTCSNPIKKPPKKTPIFSISKQQYFCFVFYSQRLDSHRASLILSAMNISKRTYVVVRFNFAHCQLKYCGFCGTMVVANDTIFYALTSTHPSIVPSTDSSHTLLKHHTHRFTFANHFLQLQLVEIQLDPVEIRHGHVRHQAVQPHRKLFLQAR